MENLEKMKKAFPKRAARGDFDYIGKKPVNIRLSQTLETTSQRNNFKKVFPHLSSS